jgi:hypothetical protein
MASVLFLAPADLGETVLATGALAHVLREDDVLTVAADAHAAPLLRAAPVARVEFREAASLGASLAALFSGERHDTVIDAHGGLAGGVAPGERRIALKPAKLLRHLVEDWTEAAGSDRALAPVLWLDDIARAEAAAIAADSPQQIVIAPGGVSAAKRWPHERFAAVARRLAGGPLDNARVVVLGAAPRDADITRYIVSSLDADGVSALDLGQGPDLLAAAALMERATLCIGNDNALTHIAAAMGAPTLTLFGPPTSAFARPTARAPARCAAAAWKKSRRWTRARRWRM